jgi:polyadenylate-binding protein
VSSSNATGLPVPKADPLVVQATDEFIDGLLDKPPQVQKQQLGDKLFVLSLFNRLRRTF